MRYTKSYSPESGSKDMSLKIIVNVQGCEYEVLTRLPFDLKPDQLEAHMQLATSVIANQMRAKAVSQ